MTTHPLIMQLAIGYTCVGIFIATSVAVVLNLFGLLRIEAPIKRKLQVALLVEVASIGVAVFSGLITIATQESTERLQIGAELAADRLERPLVFVRRKGMQEDPGSLAIAVRRAVFTEIPLFKDDTQLLTDSLNILSARGLTTETITKSVVADYPALLKAKLRWLEDQALPALAADEAALEARPQEQREASVDVELPEFLKLSPTARSTIRVGDRTALEAEVKMIQSLLSKG